MRESLSALGFFTLLNEGVSCELVSTKAFGSNDQWLSLGI